MHPGRLSLRTKLAVFNVGMVVVTLAVLVGLDLAFERVRINGPLYRRSTAARRSSRTSCRRRCSSSRATWRCSS